MANYRRSKRPLSETYQCLKTDGSTKASYRSLAKARQAIRRQRANADVPLYPYHCPRCPYWHITSQPQRKGGN